LALTNQLAQIRKELESTDQDALRAKATNYSLNFLNVLKLLLEAKETVKGVPVGKYPLRADNEF